MTIRRAIRTLTMFLLPSALILGGSPAVAQQNYEFEIKNGPGGSHVFSAEAAKELHKSNASLPEWVFKLPDGGCLRTLYFGFKSIYAWSDDNVESFQQGVYKRSNKSPSVNFAMQELHAMGLAD